MEVDEIRNLSLFKYFLMKIMENAMYNFLKNSPGDMLCFGCIFFKGVALNLGRRPVSEFIDLWEQELTPYAENHQLELGEMKDTMTFLSSVLSSTGLNVGGGYLRNNRKEIRKVIHLIVHTECSITDGDEIQLIGDFNKSLNVEEEIDKVIDKFIKYAFTVVDFYGDVPVDDLNGIFFNPFPDDLRTLKKVFKSQCNIKLCEKPASLRCSQCKLVRYCSKDCQLKDWKAHRPMCKARVFCAKNYLK
jgi:hypothetical protein